ncbi:MAG: hypothetical protein HXO06_00530 [Prevotella salivae]|uniref:hypothetical protein n=1 Tax=Segatella salivae TaxID=228604 RepID=UPI001CB2A6D1|nr:hypothetical protein [Segatella salivae]MBF1543662.1 hypothetical protein [Segatella salivae]
MERLSGDMGALDKLKQIADKLKPLDDEEAIKKFKKDFEEFEKEYETIWLSPEEFSDVSIKLSKPKLCQVNENDEWEECKDGNVNLRKLTANARQADGKPPIKTTIKTSIDHLPIDEMVEKIKDKALRNAQSGLNAVSTDFLFIYHNDTTERQEYELLNALYSKLSDIFTDTLELYIYWTYDYDMDESYMVICMEW